MGSDWGYNYIVDSRWLCEALPSCSLISDWLQIDTCVYMYMFSIVCTCAQ